MLVIAMTDEFVAASAAIAERLCGRLGATHVTLQSAVAHSNPAIQFANRFPDNDFSANLRVVGEPPPRSACAEMTTKILESAASGDVVIRGNCAISVLQPVEHVMRVRICASAPHLAKRATGYSLADDVATATELSATRAECECDADQPHGSAVCRSHEYDIVLDVNRLSVDQCVDVLYELADSQAFQPTVESTAVLSRLLRVSRQAQSKATFSHDPLIAPGTTARDPQADAQTSLHDRLAHAERQLYGIWPNRRAGRSKAPAALRACWD